MNSARRRHHRHRRARAHCQVRRTQLELLAAVARPAMLDAGLLPADVDGLLVAPMMAGAPLTQPAMVAEYLGLTPSYCDLVDLGGATAAGMVWRAGAAITVGACRHVLCVLAETIGPWAPARTFWPGLPRNEAEAIYGQAGATSAYALAADRHAAEFGTTDEQRAAVLVAQRNNAAEQRTGPVSRPARRRRHPRSADDLVAAAAVRDRACRQRRRRLHRQRRRHRRRPSPPGRLAARLRRACGSQRDRADG